MGESSLQWQIVIGPWAPLHTRPSSATADCFTLLTCSSEAFVHPLYSRRHKLHYTQNFAHSDERQLFWYLNCRLSHERPRNYFSAMASFNNGSIPDWDRWQHPPVPMHVHHDAVNLCIYFVHDFRRPLVVDLSLGCTSALRASPAFCVPSGLPPLSCR